MHTGIRVAQGGSTNGWWTVPETRGRSRAAGALRDVFIDFQVFVMMAVTETLYRSDNHLRIEFADAFPGETHAVERTRAEIFNQYIRFADQLFQHFLAFRLLGVEGQRFLVAVQHREIQCVDAGDVTQLGTRDVARTRPLDLDHVGAEPGQQLRASRTSLHMGEIDDLNAFKWFAHVDNFLL